MLILITPKGMKPLREISRVDVVTLDRDPSRRVGGQMEDSPGLIKAWIYHFRGGGEKVIQAKRVSGAKGAPGRN